MKSKFLRYLLMGLFVVGILVVTGCSDNSDTAGSDSGDSGSEQTDESSEERMHLRVFAPTFTTEPPTDDSPVLKKIEDYTNKKITMEWAPNSNIDDKFNITLSSGDLPHVMMVPGKSPSFVSAVEDGAFWELGSYLEEYPNLSQANEIIMNNSSINGDIYGIPRTRDLGRNGVIIRKDWLENLSLEKPETIDDFYNMLKAFSEEDPDGNGTDDTYGMVVSKYEGPWDVMQTWFGVPNKWGEDESGELYPFFMDDNYLESLNFFKKLYDEGLVNDDFAVMDPAQWSDPVISGEAGVQVNVLDEGHRIQEKIIDANPDNADPITVIKTVEGPTGLHNLPTSGYSGMLSVSKTSVKSEEELKQVLDFLDKMNDEEAQKLAENGIEGKHYEKVDGEYQSKVKDDPALQAEVDGFNQMLMYIPEAKSIKPDSSPLRELETQLKVENEDIVVANPAESYISEVYSKKGQQLDNIILDARIKYIVGQIDEAGLEDAVERWKSSGGTEYIEEINQLHQDAQ
ncbi:putative aldouronate transport system substrate-binding protein [Gracilibacillus orientalis]|uniref:Putative aldouronate transport system substrate-binding protein n=1 Tax=Gracilibacillus orientalis TaxID=334253 RepID=A0A1I4QSR7_9BACI|nr:extracellular solute-binding protein [Gracilibacillus orientalis]SFM43104.1 putative aldouronate transport system substrate-binding protein [Gracilibacillus orientalis]